MKILTIGPIFSPQHSCTSADPHIVPLGFQVEWATAKRAAAIPVLRHLSQHAPNKLKLENIVFPLARLPFDVDCADYHVVQTGKAIYLPLEALLSKLYSRYRISRSIFAVLSELAEMVPLCGIGRNPIAGARLLIPEAEQKGFVLNSMVQDETRAYAEIGWRPPGQECVFHTCLFEFGRGRDGVCGAGIWKPSGVIGVHEWLSRELRLLAPGEPATVFTEDGLRVIHAYNLAGIGSPAQG